MTYLAHPAHYAPEEFRALIQGLKFDKGWRPEFPTLHNTGVPSLKQWLNMGASPQERWGANLNAYYRRLGWHAGPHLVCCPSYIWNLCDLEADGVSVSCWNHVTVGIEMVGNYEVGGDDFASGDGAKVRDNAVWVLACLCETFGWTISDVLHFHHECARDRHACPGSKVSKADIAERVNALLEAWGASPTPVVSRLPAQASAPALGKAKSAPVDVSTVAGVQRALNTLGFRLDVDGVDGPDTERAIRSFQLHAGIAADGVARSVTQAAIRKELTAARG